MSSADLQVIIPPLPKPEVECFEEIPIPLMITSTCIDSIVIESVTLRFQTDAGSSDYYFKSDVGREIAPNGLYTTQLLVTPTPQFLTNTNEFQVKVRYRKTPRGVPQDPEFADSLKRFVIIKPCSKNLGQLFISFKQPEDRPLARKLETVAKRAGFQPYLAMNEPTPGMDLWDRIEPRLRQSEAVAFIWTEHTEWGDGVERESQLCKAAGIQHVLLIQQDLTPPQQFRGSIEYQRFDAEDCLEPFSDAICALREIILSNSSTN